MNLLGLNNAFIRIFCIIIFAFSLLSCSSDNDVIKVTYEIKEFADSSFDVNFTVKNTSNLVLNSPWSIHWNQQSSIIDDESVPDNVKYDYVAGQSYNILTFGKDYVLSKDSEFSIDLKQRGIVRRQSDLPVGGFIVSNDNILEIEFDYIWKNADGIEKLNPPTSVDRYNEYISNYLIEKSELDIILPTPTSVKLIDGEIELSENYNILIDEFNISHELINSIFNGVAGFYPYKPDEIDNRITINKVNTLGEESYTLNIGNNGIFIGALSFTLFIMFLNFSSKSSISTSFLSKNFSANK